MDKHDHMAAHFGFTAKKSAKEEHRTALNHQRLNPPLPFPAKPQEKEEENLKEAQQEFKEELVLLAARAGLSADQLGAFFPFLMKHVKHGRAQSLPQEGKSLLQALLSEVAKQDVARCAEERRGFQLHLCGDGAQDDKGQSVFLTTAEFNDGNSQLVSVVFPTANMDHKVLGGINEKVFADLGGTSKIDTYHHDSVGYGLKWGFTKLTDTATLFVPDPIHHVDGVLEAILDGIPVIKQLCSCMKNVFKRTNRAWCSGFYKQLSSDGFVSTRFPAPGQTRAWTGKYRILEWLYSHLDPVEKYVQATFPVTKDPSDKFKELHLLFRSLNLHDLKVVIVWALQYCADLVIAIVGWQSRIAPTVQLIFDAVHSMISFMNYSNEELRAADLFKQQVLMDDKDLFTAYKSSADKSWVKNGIVGGIGVGRMQILKNWGVFERVISEDGDEWDLGITVTGDVFKRPQLCFFSVAALLDPYNRTCQIPPSLSVLRDGFPWDGIEGKVQQIQDQMRAYLSDSSIGRDLGESGNLRVFWDSLGAKNRVKYGALSVFAQRVLATPGGSAEVERAVSAYNAIVTTDRLKLSNDNIRDYVMIYANNPQRKDKNTKRAEKRLKAQKKKKEEREFRWQENFAPTKKIL
jgi:hypothetical protein